MLKKIRPRWNHWDFAIDSHAVAPERALRRFNKSQTEFDIAFFEDVLAGSPNHLDTIRTLAELYTANGQYRQGLRMDQRVVAASPRDPVANYNLACSLSLTHRMDECFKILRQAIRLGYRDFSHMAADTDLEDAHKDARWLELFELIEV